jgi:hypothetical protein
MPPKELPTLCFGPSVLEVVNDRFANNGRQRIGGSMVGLALADEQSVALPVDIVESQVGDLAGAKAIRDHEQQHSVIAPTTDSPTVDLVEHLLDGVPTNRPRDIGQPIVLRHFHQFAQVAPDDALSARIPQENAQCAAQADHSPGSELLRRRGDESGHYRQCKGTNLLTSHMLEIALKSPQIMLIVVNGTLAKPAFSP